jgi:hypothetical protein
VGTPLAAQQKLMRHADIRTTMNVYGDVVTNEMEQPALESLGWLLERPRLPMQSVGEITALESGGESGIRIRLKTANEGPWTRVPSSSICFQTFEAIGRRSCS